MRGNRYDCWATPVGTATPLADTKRAIIRPGTLALLLPCCLAILGAAPNLQAQHWNAPAIPPYANAYAPRPNTAYGSRGSPHVHYQPIQRVENFYHGYFPNVHTPCYVSPPNYSAPEDYRHGSNGGACPYVYYPNGPRLFPALAPDHPSALSQVQAEAPIETLPSPHPEAIAESDPVLHESCGPIVAFNQPSHERFWFNASYVAAFIRPMRFASPLATIGIEGPNGALGDLSTAVVYGKESLHYSLVSGARLEAGVFLDNENRFSMDIAGFLLFPNNQTYSVGSEKNGSPLISRPIFDPRNNFILTSFPNRLAGILTIDNKAEMAGIELNARYHVPAHEGVRLEGLFGFRHVRLAERLHIQDKLFPLADGFLEFNGTAVDPPFSLADSDSFRTVNQFFGPQIGGRIQWEHCWFNLDAFVKLAIGVTNQRTTIDGSTTAFFASGSQTAAGGILALPSNIATHKRTVVGVLPEAGVNLGINLSHHVRLQLGYSLLLWNSVLRPGYQFDPNVNLGQVPGSQFFGQLAGRPSSPSYRFNDELFWTHSFNLGLGIHY